MSTLTRTRLLSLAMTLVVSPALAAQEPPAMPPEAQAEMEAYKKAGTPGTQHEWLTSKAGTWSFDGKFWMDPSQDPMESTGEVERTVMLGGRVLAETVKANEFMGQRFEGHGLMGYDNIQEQFWSTWTDNMSTHVILSTGTCDEEWECTFSGEYPDALTGEIKTMRVVSRDEGPDKEVHEGFDVGSDGEELKTMELTYTRKK